MPQSLAPTMTQSLTPAQTSLSLLGITAVSLILAVFLRRRVPRLANSVTARVGNLRGARGQSRAPGGGQSRALDPVGLTRAAFGWAALTLFAVAGVAASGTFIGRFVLWCARTVDTLVGHLPVIGVEIASAGFGLVALWALWKGLHLIGDLLEGHAHHGGADWLVFAGPMLFPLVPGYFGQGATWVYAAVASHVGPVVAHLV